MAFVVIMGPSVGLGLISKQGLKNYDGPKCWIWIHRGSYNSQSNTFMTCTNAHYRLD